MNPKFQLWITANATLVYIADNYLRAHVCARGFDSVEVAFLLEKDIINLVPEEDIAKFSELYIVFVEWALRALQLQDILSECMYSENTQREREKVADKINMRIEKYNSQNIPSFKNEFLNIMGVSPKTKPE